MSENSTGSGETSEGPIGDLLEQLASARAGIAWTEFLREFSPLIMRVSQQFAGDAERAGECFLYACEQLSDNGFRRLLSYRRDGPARFQTWLTSVVANLCIDWQRRQRGRYRPLIAIAALPEFDQFIYRFIYVRGMTRDQCLRALEDRFPGITAEKIGEANARLFSLLAPRQRWLLSARVRGSISLDEAMSPDSDQPALQPEDPGPGPDALAQVDQEQSMLEAAMARLAPQQRLLLRLRYQQDLTLEEVARLVGLPDPYRANREIQAALAALARLVKPGES